MYGITAQVSLYPLGEADLSPTIDAAIGEIGRLGVEYRTGEIDAHGFGRLPLKVDQILEEPDPQRTNLDDLFRRIDSGRRLLHSCPPHPEQDGRTRRARIR